MKIKSIVSSLVLSLFTAAIVQAATLASGKYQAQISPTVDSQTADNIEHSLNGIQQLSSIHVSSSDSMARFDVKDGQTVDVAQLQDAVKAAAPNSQMGPVAMVETNGSTQGTSGSNANPGSAGVQGTPSTNY